MAIVKHKFVSAIPDGDDTSIVRPSNWNDEHELVGVGDVVGPANATDNAVARFDTTTGKLIQNSIVTVSDTGAISGVTQENFTPVTAPAYAEGRVFYDTDAKTLCYYNDNTQMTVNIGQENIVRVRNQTGANLTNGTVVYINGATGNTPTVAKAIATSFATADIIGVLTTDISNNGFGYATTTGLVNGLDTSAFNEGDAVFLSDTVAGTFTTTEPVAPNYAIQVGVILRANPSVGTLLVTIQVISVETQHIIGLGTMATQNANAVAITGGTINGTTIGATTPSTVNATTLSGQTGVLRGTGQNLVLQSGWAGGTSGTVGSGAVAPTSWSFVNVGGTVTYASALSGSGNSIRFAATSERPAIQQSLSANFVVGLTYSLSFNVETVTSGTSILSNIFSLLNTTATFLYFVNGVSVPSSTVVTSNSKIQYVFTVSVTSGTSVVRLGVGVNGAATGDITISNPQLELGSTANTYIPTTTTAVYGTPTLSFSGVSEIGLQSNGALYLQPAGTGAIQAQATTSTAAGGNVRGANAVDWQTLRSTASMVASATGSVIGGGQNNTSSSYTSFVGAGANNFSQTSNGFVGGGNANVVNQNGAYAAIVAGNGNTASGYSNFIGGGFTNSGTSGSAVTTQSGTMNATTAVTLSGSNANIKVGQYITGTSIAAETYVAAISGTSLTLSKNASGSSTSTLSFFTPHGVVVGGGNNQATGSYSFIGGGGDAGTAANRNVASGDWSVVAGGIRNTASGSGSAVVGGGILANSVLPNTSSGQSAGILAGISNSASGNAAFIGGGFSNIANSQYSAVMAGSFGTARSIVGNHVFSACQNPVSQTSGINQTALLVLARQTTDATATALASDNNAAGTTNQVILPNNSAYFFRGEVVSGVTGGGNTKGWTIEGVIKRGANAASTALVGTPTVVSTYGDVGASTWTIAVTADTTNGGLRVTFTGQAATTIRTVCQIRTTEMTY